MDTLRRLAASPAPRTIAGWHAELLILAAMLGGVIAVLTA